MAKKISQAEARRLRRRVAELLFERERLFNAWGAGIVGGVQVIRIRMTDEQDRLLRLARKFGYVIVVKEDGEHQSFNAVK
jgi:hypothetical protein